MAHPEPAALRPLESPRAAALAGVLFAVLFTAALLLFVTSLSLWVTLIFPGWVFGVSILILVQNYRHRTVTTVS
ncbi:hypothetical protein [Microbacterium sp.]|uniref:hypothetical protein n=1 Tax=Microbacterium sp. TaxID=51671 RepID=UPI0025F5A882|nr:hypothetical protein [Microbacterium sp.]